MPKHNQITLMDDLPLGKAELGNFAVNRLRTRIVCNAVTVPRPGMMIGKSPSIDEKVSRGLSGFHRGWQSLV